MAVLNLKKCLHSLKFIVTTISVFKELGKTDLASCGVDPAFNKSKYFSQILKLIDKFELRETFQKIIHYQPNKQYNKPDNPAWILMKALLKEWINNHPKKVLVVLIPTYQYIEEISNPHNYQQRYEELKNDTNCSIYDTLPDFLKYPLKKRREFRFKRDQHFTPFGHEVLAESIYPIVNNLLANR